MDNQYLDEMLKKEGLAIRDLYRAQRFFYAFRCPRNCHVRLSDNAKLKDRCPRCGDWMLSDGVHTMDSADLRTQAMHQAHKGELPTLNPYLKPI